MKKERAIMQTFLPFADFKETAQCLDLKRLGKQRVEAMQILMVLMGLSKGWSNHPAVAMWRGYEEALSQYAYAICDKWTSHGYKDTCKEKIKQMISSKPVIMPSWMGSKDFHQSHQSNLLRKKPEHYGKFFTVPNDLPYVWPKGEINARLSW